MIEAAAEAELNPEHRALILKGFSDVLTVNGPQMVKELKTITDPAMFLAEARTKARVLQALLDGIFDKSYVASDDLREQEGQDPCCCY